MKIVFISDTHGKHEYLTSKAYNNILGSGDVLVHAGDVSNVGKAHEIKQFLDWFSNTDFTHKVFIAGNHDFGFETNTDIAPEYKNKGVHYLFDSEVVIDGIKFYGSPWQPEFYNWAFNLPRGEKLAEKWAKIPEGLDILITHGPAWGHLDTVKFNPTFNLGCELLAERIKVVKPKIHVCGHIHTGYGYKFDGDTHYFNAAVLDESYNFTQKPLTVEWNKETNEIEFLD